LYSSSVGVRACAKDAHPTTTIAPSGIAVAATLRSLLIASSLIDPGQRSLAGTDFGGHHTNREARVRH
jgi:hypothetical protein